MSFEMDDFCTKIVFINHKSRILDLYGVKWEFDKSGLNLADYNKLDDGFIEKDE